MLSKPKAEEGFFDILKLINKYHKPPNLEPKDPSKMQVPKPTKDAVENWRLKQERLQQARIGKVPLEKEVPKYLVDKLLDAH